MYPTQKCVCILSFTRSTEWKGMVLVLLHRNDRETTTYLPTFYNAHGGFTCKMAFIVIQGGLQIHLNVVIWLLHTLTSL